jgi:divalent metal cation (Fe/Co/Zn/Cd) transporter
MSETLNHAKKLILFTIVYNFVEGIFAIYFGAESNSTSLLSFGLDSFIEITASVIALWGLSSIDKDVEDKAEKMIAYSFLILILFIVVKSSFDLFYSSKPETSFYGIVIACVSILVEGPLAYRKLQLGKKLNNKIIIVEAKETLFCLNLSVLVILGVGVNYFFGLWYFDPIAALLMIPWLFREFREHNQNN